MASNVQAKVDKRVNPLLPQLYERLKSELRSQAPAGSQSAPPLNLGMTQPPPITAANCSSPFVFHGPRVTNFNRRPHGKHRWLNKSSRFHCLVSNIDDASTRLHVSQEETMCILQAQVLDEMVPVNVARVESFNCSRDRR